MDKVDSLPWGGMSPVDHSFLGVLDAAPVGVESFEPGTFSPPSPAPGVMLTPFPLRSMAPEEKLLERFVLFDRGSLKLPLLVIEGGVYVPFSFCSLISASSALTLSDI
jgi:hypothetical protein